MGDVQPFRKIGGVGQAGGRKLAEPNAAPARRSDYALFYGFGAMPTALTLFGVWKAVELVAHIRETVFHSPSRGLSRFSSR